LVGCVFKQTNIKYAYFEQSALINFIYENKNKKVTIFFPQVIS